MNVAHIVEMLNVSPVPARAASPAQASDEPPQTFNETLLAASKLHSSTGTANQAGTGGAPLLKPVSQEAKLPPTTPHVRPVPPPGHSQNTAQQQVQVAQQPRSINPALIPKHLPPEEPGRSARASTVADGQPTSDVPAITLLPMDSKPAGPTVANPDSVPSSHTPKEHDSPPAAPVLPLVEHVLEAASHVSNAVANITPNAVLSMLSNPLSKNPSVFANADPAILPNAFQKAVAPVVSSSPVSAVPSVPTAAFPTAVLRPVPITDSSADSDPAPGAAPSVVSTASPNAVPSAEPNADPSVAPAASLSAVPIAHRNPASSPVPSSAPVVPSAIEKPLRGGISNTIPTTFAGTLPSAIQNSAPPVALNAIPDASSSAAPAPVSHGAVNSSASGAVAPKSSTVSTRQTDPPAATPEPSGLATGPSVPDATADQLAALIQPAGGLLGVALANGSSVSPAAVAKPSAVAPGNGKDGANNAINDATGLKQHAQVASNQTASQTDSQGTAQSGDQSQGDASQQGQTAVPAQVSFANHTIAAVDHAQNGGGAAPMPTAVTPAGVTGHTAKTADTPTPATIALPQAVPVINTAKLIQSMGQSEMRVGMRSNDFGNISISTSATRDLISAQISLDHGELARTLAAHLPEMQARLGGSQAMDVRIDMNGQATGQGGGTPGGMSNGSPDGSRGDRQQKGSAASSQSSNGFAAQGNSIGAAGVPSSEGRLDARLDIRV